MKNQMRRAMLSTICMLIVGVISLTGVTYAWFSSGKTVNVTDLNVTVESAAGAIKVATPDVDGKLNFGGTAEPNLAAYAEKKLLPVSAAVPTSGAAMAFYKAEMDSNNMIKTYAQSASIDGGNAYWYQYDLYFYNDGTEDLTVYLDSASSIAANGGASTAEDSSLATRVAFASYASDTYQNILDNGFTASEYVGAVSDTVFFEPNATKHTAWGTRHYAAAVASGYEAKTSAQAYPYKAVAAGTETASDLYNGAHLTSGYVTTNAIGSATEVATVGGGEVTKVTVYVWLEGQDADCQNDISASAFKGSFAFTTDAPTAG